MERASLAERIRDDRVHSSVYTDPEIFALERERIFRRAWLYVGHESQMRAPGDYFMTTLAGEPVLVTSDGKAVHIFYNRCSHRGARLCDLPAGNVRRFICPYHGWAFGTDGRLLGVPMSKGYPPDFDLKDPALGLTPVARVATYRGFIFASLAPTGPDLTRFLGPIAAVIDNLVDRSPSGEVEIAGGVQRHFFRGNWKLLMENLQDYAHPTFAHESSIAVARGDRADDKEFRQEDIMLANGADYAWIEKAGCWAFPGGHSYVGALPIQNYVSPEAAAEYRIAMEARYGAARTDEILNTNRHIAVIWPSVAIHAFFRQIKIVQPVAPDLTEVQVWTVRLKGAPPEYHRATVKFLNATNSPGSLILTDDLVIFERAQQAIASNDGWVHLANGYGRDIPDNHGGWRGTGSSELPMRNQYAAWRALMLDSATP